MMDRTVSIDEMHERNGQTDTRGTTHHDKQRCLRQNLPREPPRTCSQSGAHRQLATAHGSAHQQQAGDVRARNQQDAEDCAKRE